MVELSNFAKCDENSKKCIISVSNALIGTEFGEFRQKLKNWENALIRSFGSPWVLLGSIPYHLKRFGQFRVFSFFFNS